MYIENISNICIGLKSSIHVAIECIDRNALGIALVVDNKQHLLGTITDGDIRRAMLSGDNLDAPISILLDKKPDSLYPKPITALVGTPNAKLLTLMQEHVIRQIPLINEYNQVVDIVSIDNLLPDQLLPIEAVVMAGGFGTRLRPLTEDLPKPLLPIGDTPLIEHTLKRLRESGIKRINITTHYLSEKIIEQIGDGETWGLDINYVTEDRPLGTAGAIGLIKESNEPLLVVNGDILTQLDFRAMLAFHLKHKADLTIGVRHYDIQVPYAVVDCDGPLVKEINEKPALTIFVNAGIYLLEPSVHRTIIRDIPLDMPDLIQRLLRKGHTVVSFPILEYWLDIGHHEDYKKAQEDLKNGRLRS